MYWWFFNANEIWKCIHAVLSTQDVFTLLKSLKPHFLNIKISNISDAVKWKSNFLDILPQNLMWITKMNAIKKLNFTQYESFEWFYVLTFVSPWWRYLYLVHFDHYWENTCLTENRQNHKNKNFPSLPGNYHSQNSMWVFTKCWCRVLYTFILNFSWKTTPHSEDWSTWFILKIQKIWSESHIFHIFQIFIPPAVNKWLPKLMLTEVCQHFIHTPNWMGGLKYWMI